jgi:aminoglycoside phosphotransferase (APT) family kinase protein
MPVYNRTGWLVEATPAQRRALWESAVDQLAAIHRVPVEEVGFVDRPARGETGIDQQLTYWTDFASWALGDAVPDRVRAVLDWLGAHVPTDEPAGLSWGDARMGNMMFDDDFQCVGVMDWEQASLAGPMADLGWWLFFDDIHSVDQGLDRLDGLGTAEETIDRWQQLTGLQVGDLLWHQVFAGCKAGLLSLRTRTVMNIASTLPTEQSDPFMARACRLLDAASPAGWR